MYPVDAIYSKGEDPGWSKKNLPQLQHKVAGLEAKGLLCSNSQTCTLSQNGYGADIGYHSLSHDDIWRLLYEYKHHCVQIIS